MSHTEDKYYADNPHSGGFLMVPAHLLKADSANLAWARNAAGDYSLNRTAAGAETYHVIADLSGYLRTLGTQAAWSAQAQEQFQLGLSAWGSTSVYGQTQLTVPTTQPAKGIKILNVWLVYGVGVADLTSSAINLQYTTFVNQVAPAVTAVALTATTITLTKTVVTTPYEITVPVTTPAFINTDFSDVTADWTIVMANTGTIRVYGIGMHFDFNFN